MNKTRKRSFTVLLFVLVSLFALVLSLGILSACGNEETLSADENASSETWHYGTGDPADDIGVPGDHYLNTETLTSFVKEGKTWREATAEEAGSWYYGTSAPADKLGNAGDFFLNKETGELYHKSEGGWGTPVLTLKGVPGRDGVVWFSGTGEPDTEALKDPQAGDFYLKTDGFVVYQLQPDGTWLELGSIKGETGDDAKDPVQFYSGYGKPSAEITEQANEGDLYLGRFLGTEEGNEGAGTRLYRYLDGEWKILVEDMHAQQLNIYTYGQLLDFAVSAQTNDFAGKEVHLKTDIDFNEIEAASLHRALAARASEDWTPIGTSETPFRGIFDGEGHKIENFSAKTTDSATAVGFFGHVENATIEHLHFVAANVEVSGSGAVGAVVVGQSKGVSFNDVTVTGNSTVKAESGATTGSLVGSSEGTVTVENVEVESKTEGTESGEEDTTLVGSGEVTFTGKNVVEYPISDGFVETHYKNGEETTVIYEISSLAGLKSFRDSVNGTGDFEDKAESYANKTVALVNDIDFADEPEHPEDQWYSIRWTPIGKSESPFSGTFDGQGHILKNLSKDYSNNKSAAVFRDFGLFARTGDGATFRNFTLENVTMLCRNDSASSHTQSVAAVVASPGTNNSFSNIHVVGNIAIKGSWYVGGIVGYGNTGMTIDGCEVNGNGEKGGTITLECTYAGGIVGFAQEGTRLTNNVVKNISFEMHENPNHPNKDTAVGAVGGISGIAHAGCVITGSTVENVVFNFRDGAELKDAGAVAGIYLYSATAATTISDNHGNVEMYDHTKEFPITKMYNYGLVGEERNYSSDKNFIMENNNFSIKFQGVPYNTTTNEWSISSPEELEALAALADGGMNFAGQTIKLMKSISLAGIKWSSPDFSGVTFDGNDMTISDITCATDDENGVWRAGLFGHFNGTVKNLTLTNVIAKGAQVGALYGHSDGITLENVTVSGNINITYDAKHGETYPGIGVVGGINADNAAHAGSVKVAADCVAKLVTKDFDSHKDPTYDSKYTATTQLVLGFVKYDLENFNKCITVEEGAQITYGVAKVGDTAYLSIKDAFAALEDGSTLTLIDDVTIEGASPYNKGLLEINANSIIDLNGKTFSAKDTNMDPGYIISVGEEVTSFEIKNGKINYGKPYDDYFEQYNGAFLNWYKSDAMARSLMVDHVQIDGTGQALFLKNGWTRDNNNEFIVTVNDCNFVGNIDLICNIDFTATNLNFGKLSTSGDNISIELTGGSFDGSLKVYDDIYAPSGTIVADTFTATGTRITDSICFTLGEPILLTDCVINGTLVLIGGSNYTMAKLTNTTFTDYKLLGDRYVLRIGDDLYRGKTAEKYGLDVP